MPLISNDLAAAEVRVKELTAKIALRESQRELSMSEGVAHGHADQHITNLRTELHKAAAIVVTKFDPLGVIAAMSHVCPACTRCAGAPTNTWKDLR
jgi:hypothetical protein